MLTQRQITSPPWRWRLFGAEVMLRHGLIALESSSDEILETVKEVEEMADQIGGQVSESPIASTAPADPDGLIELWRGCLGLPNFYGNARPSLYFLHKYRLEFLRDWQSAIVQSSRVSSQALLGDAGRAALTDSNRIDRDPNSNLL